MELGVVAQRNIAPPACVGGTPTRSDFLVFGRPQIKGADIRAVQHVLEDCWIGQGPKVQEFETAIAKYCHAGTAVACNSATAGLILALEAVGVEEGTEVITTPMTFVSTANAIYEAGATPVFVDVDATGNIAPDKIANAITHKTSAILPVHLAGQPCDMASIHVLANQKQIPVVEDAAHALETVAEGQKTGSGSSATVFSFYATKNLTTAEGGMVTTNDPNIAERMRVLRLHGFGKDAWDRYSASGWRHSVCSTLGHKFNMTDIAAALGLSQLARLDANWLRRVELVKQYNQLLRPLFDLGLIGRLEDKTGSNGKNAFHLYQIMVNLSMTTLTRDQILFALKEENIGTGVHFIPVHLHPLYRALGYTEGMFPRAEQIGETTISLPLYPQMQDKDVLDVATALHKVLLHFRR